MSRHLRRIFCLFGRHAWGPWIQKHHVTRSGERIYSFKVRACEACPEKAVEDVRVYAFMDMMAQDMIDVHDEVERAIHKPLDPDPYAMMRKAKLHVKGHAAIDEVKRLAFERSTTPLSEDGLYDPATMRAIETKENAK